MKQNIKHEEQLEHNVYVPASIKVLNVSAQRAICQSGGTENSLEGDTTDWF